MNREEKDAANQQTRSHHGRQIPWLPVVRFHKEVVARAEAGFFSLNGRDDQADRWSSLSSFAPVDLAGPWTIAEGDIVSRPFRLTLEQGQHESLFLGGPCFLGWTRSLQGNSLPQWRPLLYREVTLQGSEECLEVVPQQGGWSLTPLLYSLFDRMEVSLGASLDEFATVLIETAAGYLESADEPLDYRIFRALYSKVPGVEEEFDKRIGSDTFRVQPTPWVLFAPTGSYSALTRHLMQDYERLESLLVEDETNIGGLRLLEDQQMQESVDESDVLPLIPLNPSQRRAVQRILERRPLTVISGPPGTGKSQAVVALLLNAWAQGQTVLFASNNNKAVDVVRERVERFESEFPIAVRAGANKRQNIQEVLRRTLNMAGAAADGSGKAVDPAKLRRKREKSLDERKALLDALDSRLPQRIDESRKTALKAYGEYRSTLAGLNELERSLIADKAGIGFDGQQAAQVEAALEETREWLSRTDEYRALVKSDDQRRIEILDAITSSERRRDLAVQEFGLSGPDGGDWRWLITGPSVELIVDWERRFRDLISKPVEQALEPIDWHEEYARWRSAEQADDWAGQARVFSEQILRACAELAPKLAEAHKLTTIVEEGRARVRQLGLPEACDLPLDALRDWNATYAELATREHRRLDSLPWSHRERLRRRLQSLEQQLRAGLPFEVLARVGTLNEEGRQRLAPVVEGARRWLELRREWDKAQPLFEEIENRFRSMRSQAGALNLHPVPIEQDTEAWRRVSSQREETAAVAERAAMCWRQRVEKEAMEELLRVIAKDWGRLASGVPLREAWRRGQGRSFDETLRALADQPNSDTVAAARGALYAGGLARLIECWQTAAESEGATGRLQGEFRNAPELSDRVKSWWTERPARAFVLQTGSHTDWPDLEEAEAALARAGDWCRRWNRFADGERPDALQKAAGELEWAAAKLEQAIEVLPIDSEKTKVSSIFEAIKAGPEQDWPLAELNQAFAAYSPDRIRSRIERIEAELERGSFEDAKARWLERLRSDDEAICAVDALEKSIRQYKGQVVESQYDTFRTALRAVPIWITTAQASQAIPLEPELFDIVVIDEASQCTLTNLLPLMYRGKTLAVIGDDNQLPAIPTIQESEELALARKFGIEEYLSLIGHATNDVYKAAAESLPRRRADVIMLDEHFRSHPQIIGFSNRYIYQQRLELKKDPSWGERLPIGSGVHSVPVMGTARRGDKGRSWVNEPEAEAVLELLQRLKQGDSRSLSIGVVTPFAAQKDFLRGRLDTLRLASEVLVDTAYGFQGDERDVIVFSPVVAKGITSSAGRWVESPPNLINVAITRAREALFVVGDFDYCLQQEGILRKLALYCRDVQLLRDTSPAELELFSWMVVKGWEPKIHPRIGDIEVDFVLVSVTGVRLAIEVDGRQHHEMTREQDKARDAYLMGQNHEVMRFPAREVLETPFEVIHQIDSRLEE